MRILLADDHGLFLEGLSNLLRAGGHTVVGTANDGLQAVQLARDLRPDTILMDIRMPGCDGLTATRVIHTEQPQIKIVMLTTSADDADLFEALKSGASGYLLKNLQPNQLFDLLSGLGRGEAALSREVSALVLREFARQASVIEGRTGAVPSAQATTPELTPRQREIIGLVASGLTYKQVGSALSLSENTIKYHMGEVLDRLHLSNREQAVAYALRTGLVRGQYR